MRAARRVHVRDSTDRLSGVVVGRRLHVRGTDARSTGVRLAVPLSGRAGRRLVQRAPTERSGRRRLAARVVDRRPALAARHGTRRPAPRHVAVRRRVGRVSVADAAGGVRRRARDGARLPADLLPLQRIAPGRLHVPRRPRGRLDRAVRPRRAAAGGPGRRVDDHGPVHRATRKQTRSRQ